MARAMSVDVEADQQAVRSPCQMLLASRPRESREDKLFMSWCRQYLMLRDRLCTGLTSRGRAASSTASPARFQPLSSSSSPQVVFESGVKADARAASVQHLPSAGTEASPVPSTEQNASAVLSTCSLPARLQDTTQTSLGQGTSSRSIFDCGLSSPEVALVTAIARAQVPTVQSLIEAGVNVNATCPCCFPTSPLHVAAVSGELSMVALLIEGGSNLHTSDCFGLSPLHVACALSCKEVVAALMIAGSPVSAVSSLGETPLQVACEAARPEIVPLLMRETSLSVTKLPSRFGTTPVMLCCRFGLMDALVQLRPTNNDMLTVNETRDTPLHLAVWEGRAECVELICRVLSPDMLGSILRAPNFHGDTPVHTATRRSTPSHLRILKLFVAIDSSLVHEVGAFGQTPLHTAAMCGNDAAVDLLLKCGARPTAVATLPETFQRSPCSTVTLAHTSSRRPSSELSQTTSVSDAGHIFEPPALMRFPGNQLAALVGQPCHDLGNLCSRLSFMADIDGRRMTPAVLAYIKGHDRIYRLLNLCCEDLGLDPLCGAMKLPSPLGRIRRCLRAHARRYRVLKRLTEQRRLVDPTTLSFDRILGQGSIGTVHLVRFRSSNGQSYAAKRLKLQCFRRTTSFAMIVNEIDLLSQISHPNILQFVGASLDCPENAILVTCYELGGTVYDVLHLHRRDLSFSRRMNILVDVSNALMFLHGMSVPLLHRDINTHNILLSSKARAILSDFGEAAFQQSSADPVDRPGNMRWMAPEVFQLARPYSTASDVYSFALVCWEVSHGAVPFSELESAEAASKAAARGVRPELSIGGHCSLQLAQCIRQGWAANPEHRPTAMQMWTCIRQLASQAQLPNANVARHTPVQHVGRWAERDAGSMSGRLNSAQAPFGQYGSGTAADRRDRGRNRAASYVRDILEAGSDVP